MSNQFYITRDSGAALADSINELYNDGKLVVVNGCTVLRHPGVTRPVATVYQNGTLGVSVKGRTSEHAELYIKLGATATVLVESGGPAPVNAKALPLYDLSTTEAVAYAKAVSTFLDGVA